MPGRRHRRQQSPLREVARIALPAGFALLEIVGFCLANFAERESWAELAGFLLLQPMQILVNLLDARLRLTRGMSDTDAVMLVTLVSLPLNVGLWYSLWRTVRNVRQRRRRKRRVTARGNAAGREAARQGTATGGRATHIEEVARRARVPGEPDGEDGAAYERSVPSGQEASRREPTLRE